MNLEQQLDELQQRKRELQESLAQRKKEFVNLQREKKRILQNQIRRAQSRLSAADRKRRTRRLILIGSYIDSVAQNDTVSMARLRKGLDEFLERDRDRELFDLPPRS